MDKRAEAKQLALDALRTRPPAKLLAEPIEYIFADHFRQRTLCGFLDEISEAKEADSEVVDAVLDFMKSDLSPHILDEELGLFPLVRQRAEPEDKIHHVLDQLIEEHSADETDASEIIEQLNELKISNEKQCIDVDTAKLFKRFAANERQHLIVENAIVLPLARVRLTEEDRANLGRQMAARRDLAFHD